MSSTLQPAKAYVKRELVLHQRFDVVLNAVGTAIQRARHTDPQVLPIIGPTRVGKTTLVEQIIRANPPTPESNTRPILYIRCQRIANIRSLADMCLRGIGHNPALFKNYEAATNAFIQSVKNLGVLLIIFDESQEMLERAKQITLRSVGDFFKKMADSTGASIVITGLPTLEQVFHANEQLRDRSLAPIKFYPYWYASSGFRHFRVALSSALQYFKEGGWETFDYSDVDFARRMYVASAGRYGIITKIFADIEAYHAETKTALAQQFKDAYSRTMHGYAAKLNPFDPTTTINDESMSLAYSDVLQESGAPLEVLEDDNAAV